MSQVYHRSMRGIQSAHSRKVHWSSAIQLELEHNLRKQQPPLASFFPTDLKIRAKRFQICAAPADRLDGPAPPRSSAYGCYYVLYKHHHHVWIIQENIYRWVQGRLRICAEMTSSFQVQEEAQFISTQLHDDICHLNVASQHADTNQL